LSAERFEVTGLNADDLSVMFGNPPFSSAFQAVAEDPASGMAVLAKSEDVRVIAYQPEQADAAELLQAYTEARVTVEPETDQIEIAVDTLHVIELRVPPSPECLAPCWDEVFVAASEDVLYVVQASDRTSAMEVLTSGLP
jgi:hypothetical protein